MIRTEKEQDNDFLWEMLYQAIFIAEGEIGLCQKKKIHFVK